MLHNLCFIFHKCRLFCNFIFFCSNNTFLTNRALKCKCQPVHLNNNFQFFSFICSFNTFGRHHCVPTQFQFCLMYNTEPFQTPGIVPYSEMSVKCGLLLWMLKSSIQTHFCLEIYLPSWLIALIDARIPPPCWNAIGVSVQPLSWFSLYTRTIWNEPE